MEQSQAKKVKNILQNLSEVEREEQLRQSAHVIEDHPHKFEFTEKELNDVREEFTAQHMEVEDLEDQKKDVVADFNEKIKPRRAAADELLLKIRHGGNIVDEYQFGVANKGMMVFFNARGEYRRSRPLSKKERDDSMQTKVIPMLNEINDED